KWKGRIGVAPTNASFIAFVSTMELVDGTEKTREWLQGLVANDVQTFSGNGAILQAVDAGDLDAGLVNHYYLLGLIADQGSATARNHFLAAGDPGALVAATGVGVLEPSDNKEAAVEFIRYLLSEEAQRHFAENLNEYGLIEGAPTPKDQKPRSEPAGPDINRSDLADHLESAVGLIAEVRLSSGWPSDRTPTPRRSARQGTQGRRGPGRPRGGRGGWRPARGVPRPLGVVGGGPAGRVRRGGVHRGAARGTGDEQGRSHRHGRRDHPGAGGHVSLADDPYGP